MEASLKVKNIVLNGVFKIQSFDRYFFINNKILKEEEILDDSIFAPMESRIVSKNFHISVQSNLLVIAINSPETNLVKIEEIAALIAKSINLKSIRAIGFNFNWFLTYSDSMEKVSRRLFYKPEVEVISKFFNSEDSIYGITASTNFKNSRLRFSSRPAKVKQFQLIKQADNLVTPIIKDEPETDAIVADFNYHIVPDGNKDMQMYFSEYNLYFENSHAIISTLN